LAITRSNVSLLFKQIDTDSEIKEVLEFTRYCLHERPWNL